MSGCCWCCNWEFLLLFQVSLLNIFSTLADFPTVWFWRSCCCWNSWCPIVPATAVIFDVNSVLACCYWLHYFRKHPCFCWRPYCVGRLLVAFIPTVGFLFCCCGQSSYCSHPCCWLLLTSLLLIAYLLLMAFLLLLASLCFISRYSHCCWPPCYCNLPGIVGFAAVALVPACFLVVAGILVTASIPADPGVPILDGLLHTILYNLHCTMEQIRVCLTIGLWLANCYFFLLSYYPNIEYHTDSKKLSVANLW